MVWAPYLIGVSAWDKGPNRYNFMLVALVEPSLINKSLTYILVYYILYIYTIRL